MRPLSPRPAARSGFDYSQLTSSIRRDTQEEAIAIRKLLTDTTANVIQIGLRLRLVREQIGREHFQEWLRTEFEWNQSVASNYMQAAQLFHELDCLAQFQPSALFVLGRHRVREAARQEALRRARSGELITKEKAEEIAAKHGGSRRRSNVARQVCVSLEHVEERLAAIPDAELIRVLEKLQQLLTRIEARLPMVRGRF